MPTKAKQIKTKVLADQSTGTTRIGLEVEIDALADVLLGLRRRVINLEAKVSRLQARVGPKRKLTRKPKTSLHQEP